MMKLKPCPFCGSEHIWAEEYKGYLKGNIIKYRERAGRKGDAETDHAKARWHYERIEQ